ARLAGAHPFPWDRSRPEVLPGAGPRMGTNGSNGHDADPAINYMQALGVSLVENGYSILPIAPPGAWERSGKAPGIWTRDSWRPMPGWTRYCSRSTTLIEVGIWSRWPQCGVGQATGDAIAIDIDVVEDAETCDRIEELARTSLGDTPLIRVGLW